MKKLLARIYAWIFFGWFYVDKPTGHIRKTSLREIIIKFFNSIVRGYRYTTVHDCEERYRYLNKKQIIRNIVHVAAQLNGAKDVIDSQYEKMLRAKGKKVLIRTLLLLKVAHSKKLEGIKNYESCLG